MLKEQARQDAQGAKQRIASESQKLSATIVSDARTTAQNFYAELKAQLLQELGARVLDRTEAVLRERLTGDDKVRIRQEFSVQVEGAK